jgi:hypothetical protein
MACFANAYPKITVAAKARFREQEHLSEMATFVQVESPHWKSVNASAFLGDQSSECTAPE